MASGLNEGSNQLHPAVGWGPRRRSFRTLCGTSQNPGYRALQNDGGGDHCQPSGAVDRPCQSLKELPRALSATTECQTGANSETAP